MSKLLLTTSTVEDFFAHGRKIAKLADHGLPIPEEKIIRFEDPVDLVNLLTERRINVVRELKKHPSTVSQLSTALARSRSSVKMDVDVLERAGILFVTTAKTSGMRNRKVVQVAAHEISLVAAIV